VCWQWPSAFGTGRLRAELSLDGQLKKKQNEADGDLYTGIFFSQIIKKSIE
jgi:hypothetical protein